MSDAEIRKLFERVTSLDRDDCDDGVEVYLHKRNPDGERIYFDQGWIHNPDENGFIHWNGYAHAPRTFMKYDEIQRILLITAAVLLER